MLLPVDVALMVEMRRLTVAKGAAKKFFPFLRAGRGKFSKGFLEDLDNRRVMVEMRKASFGGDRSEAGRYAANIRWQGNTVDSPPLVGYSGDMEGAEKLKSQLHILASTTDTKLAELNGKLGGVTASFRQSVEAINKLAGVYEKTEISKFSREYYQFMQRQEQKHFFHFKRATPEERQRLIDLAKKNADFYNQESLERALKHCFEGTRNCPNQSRNRTTKRPLLCEPMATILSRHQHQRSCSQKHGMFRNLRHN